MTLSTHCCILSDNSLHEYAKKGCCTYQCDVSLSLTLCLREVTNLNTVQNIRKSMCTAYLSSIGWFSLLGTPFYCFIEPC